MIIDIYKVNSNSFISVPSGTNIDSVTNSIKNKQLVIFKKDVDLGIKHRIALDDKNIINQINANGYALHSVEIEMQELQRV